MPISPISTFSTSATLSQLVTVLTRPLSMLYSAEIVSQLQITLHANFKSMFPVAPFTILLSPTSLPPTPIYAACLQAGIAWPEWIRVLGGQIIYILVMDGSLILRIGESGEPLTLWSEDPIEIPAISKTVQGINSLPLPKLRSMLNSVRERTVRMDVQSPQPISLPTLLSASEPSMGVDESDSNSDSDCESNASSSLFSEASSAESMTSGSSSSSPTYSTSDLPLMNPSTVTKKSSVYVPPHKLSVVPSIQDSDSIPSHRLLSRSQRRLARVTIDKSKNLVCQYNYQGGQTGVMTGGVMLGKSCSNMAKPAPSAANSSPAPLRRTLRKRSDSVLLGPDCSNWRRVRA